MTDRRTDPFARALDAAAPPPHWPAPLAALWWVAGSAGEGTGDEAVAEGPAWDRAHALVQDDPGRDAAWVHAHLHRLEGDPGNARYWYARAGRPEPETGLAAERAAIAAALLAALPAG